MRVLKTGDPCPCCGRPIKLTNPESLAMLAFLADMLGLPEFPAGGKREERETFMMENHIVDGEEKAVIDMTSRELEKEIGERDKARKAAEAQAAEESRARMDADTATLRAIHQAAQEAEAQARKALAAARSELAALREKPLDVAVETAVDQEAANKARMEAIAEMQAKVDAAETARGKMKKMKTQCKQIEAEFSILKKQAMKSEENLSRAKKAEAALASTRRRLEAVTNPNAERDRDMALFNVLLSQIRMQVNQVHDLYQTLGRDDEVLHETLKFAILSLADMVRERAE